jgi:ribonuclease HI
MSLKKTCRVIIYSDSQYLVRTMQGEYQRGTNIDLWHDLDFACLRHQVKFKWVRGHNGDMNNERAHDLAEAGMRRNKS